jgi:hypothetical protein
MDMSMWASPGPATLTAGEQVVVACCWAWLGYYWLQSRRRAKRSTISRLRDGTSEMPTNRSRDWLLLRLWIYWPRELARVMLPLLLTIGIVGSVVDVIRRIPIGR